MKGTPGAPLIPPVQSRVTEDGMGDKIKPLCKWKASHYIKELELLKTIVAAPAFVCRDCGRAADQKRWLCKPVRL
jgi:hypothetical protein